MRCSRHLDAYHRCGVSLSTRHWDYQATLTLPSQTPAQHGIIKLNSQKSSQQCQAATHSVNQGKKFHSILKHLPITATKLYSEKSWQCAIWPSTNNRRTNVIQAKTRRKGENNASPPNHAEAPVKLTWVLGHTGCISEVCPRWRGQRSATQSK